MKFDLLKDPLSKARAGSITTDHGVIETPIYASWYAQLKECTNEN
jgi:queuine/archaeosine tRNA-ribosyltransferase